MCTNMSFTLLIGVWLILAYQTFVGDTHQEISQYCNMVQLYKESKGTAGWPPYRQNTQCEKYESKRVKSK